MMTKEALLEQMVVVADYCGANGLEEDEAKIDGMIRKIAAGFIPKDRLTPAYWQNLAKSPDPTERAFAARLDPAKLATLKPTDTALMEKMYGLLFNSYSQNIPAPAAPAQVPHQKKLQIQSPVTHDKLRTDVYNTMQSPVVYK